MDKEHKDHISKLVLRVLLKEILKDGIIEENEKKALEKITTLLSINKDLFQNIMKEVKKEMVVDKSAGSFNKVVFFKKISSLLMSFYEKDQILLLLNEISSALNIDDSFIEKNMDDIFTPKLDSKNREKYNVIKKDFISYVEIFLDNDSCRTEAGAMAYMLGNIEMEAKGSGGIGGYFKSALSGETFYKPVYTGSGKLVLEPSTFNFYKLELNDEHFILDKGAYFASDLSIEVSAYTNKAVSSLFSGEGWFQTSVQGSGTVIMTAPGKIEILELKNDTLVVDGNFVVARSGTLDFEVTRSTNSLLGSIKSGEGLVNKISGTGKVYIAMIQNRHIMMGRSI